MIQLNFRTDRNLFDLQKLKAKTKVSQNNVLELQYADDCALVSDSAEGLQRILTHTGAYPGFRQGGGAKCENNY